MRIAWRGVPRLTNNNTRDGQTKEISPKCGESGPLLRPRAQMHLGAILGIENCFNS